MQFAKCMTFFFSLYRLSSSDRHSSFSTLKNSFRRGQGSLRPRALFGDDYETPEVIENPSEEMQCDVSKCQKF